MKAIIYLLTILMLGIEAKSQSYQLCFDLSSINCDDTLIVQVKKKDSYEFFDSIYLKNNERKNIKKYTFSEPTFLSINVGNRGVYKQLIIDNTVTVKFDSLKGSFDIIGSTNTDELNVIQTLYTNPARTSIVQINNVIRSFDAKADSILVDSLLNVQKLIMDSLKFRYKEYIINHPNSYASLDLLMWGYKSFGLTEAARLIEGLNEQIQNHTLTIYLQDKIKMDLSISDGKPLPSFNIQDERGNIFSDNNIREGLFLIDFWGTWCGPCLQSLPELLRLQVKYKLLGLKLISYAREFDIKKQQFEEVELKYGISWDSYYETREKPSGLIEIFNIQEYPTYFLVKDGVIIKRSSGSSDLRAFVDIIRVLLGD
jgi:thiol-disulfide isomerase/thioredoxin